MSITVCDPTVDTETVIQQPDSDNRCMYGCGWLWTLWYDCGCRAFEFWSVAAQQLLQCLRSAAGFWRGVHMPTQPITANALPHRPKSWRLRVIQHARLGSDRRRRPWSHLWISKQAIITHDPTTHQSRCSKLSLQSADAAYIIFYVRLLDRSGGWDTVVVASSSADATETGKFRQSFRSQREAAKTASVPSTDPSAAAGFSR